MPAPLAGMVWTGLRWAAKKVAKKRKAKVLKRLQSPSKLSKDVTKHSKAQRVRAQIADPKRKFPSAKKIKKSRIKLKDLDPKHSRKEIDVVKYKPKDKLNKGVRIAYGGRKGTWEGKYAWQEAYNARTDAHPRHYWKKITAGSIGTGAVAKTWYDAQEKTRKKIKASKPYSQRTPVRGIQLGPQGTQSGTHRTKRKKGY